jgi:uncharacterized membrane protein HdeD (DUF308 family)
MTMAVALSPNSWWTFALRGLIAVAFGVLALAWPKLTLLGLVVLFAAFALFGGVVSIWGALVNRKTDDAWLMLLLLGLVSVGAGIIAIVRPDITLLVLVLLMGANAIATGVLDIALAVRLRREIRGEWVLVLAGLISIAFGVLVFLFPDAGALAMVWLIGFYAIAIGILLLVAAWRLRRHPEAASWGGGMGQPAH